MATRLSLRRLGIFDAVMRHGSAGAAARRLGLSQPAISHALGKLENEVGARLVDRGPGGSYGTKAGRILHRRVERMLRQVEHGVIALGQDAGQATPEAPAVAHNLTTTQVRCHIAIAEHGSFRAAARALDIAEPTLHRAARELERSLRAPLYRRILHGMEATAGGVVFANCLRLALNEIDQAIDELAAESGIADGQVSVGSLPLMPKQLLARAVGRLLRIHPGVRIEVEEGSHDFLLAGLRSGTIDLVIGALRDLPLGGDLVERELFDDPYVVVARSGHPLAQASRVTEADLADYSWVVPTRNTPRRATVEALFDRLPRRPRVTLETGSLAMMTSTLIESDCLTLLSRSQASLGQPGAGLAVLPASLTWPLRLVGTTTRLAWLPTRVQRNFLAIVDEECRAMVQPQGSAIRTVR
jgi:LysR family transcriptional regulator of gallate degradation